MWEVFSFILGISLHFSSGAPTAGTQNLTSQLCKNPAEPGEFPSVVSIIYKENHACEGVILNPSWILTSATCIKENDFKLVAGRLGQERKDDNEQVSFSMKVTIHPSYKRNSFENDIALVKISPKFNFSETVQPTELPGPDFLPYGDAFSVSWRTAEESCNSNASHFQKQAIKIIPNIKCAAAYGADFRIDKMTCGEVGTKENPVYFGSSGSPLFCASLGVKQNELCGIFSFRSHLPQISYTKVAYYSTWIRSIIKGDEEKSLQQAIIMGQNRQSQKCGTVVRRNEFPFVVSLFRGRNHICEGALINSSWVLTAASCLKIRDFGIIAGDHNLSVKEGPEQVAIPIQVVKHPYYDPTTFENDIALIKIFPSIENAETISIPDFRFQVQAEGTVVGWGTYETMFPSIQSVLQKQTVKLLPNAQCGTVYGKLFHNWNNLCGGDGQGKGSCVGLTGSPLVCYDQKNMKKVLCGITDFGEYGSPTVFSKISYYSDWIKKEISKGKQRDVSVVGVGKFEATYVKQETVVVRDKETGESFSYVKTTVIVVVVIVVFVGVGAGGGGCLDD